MYSIVYSFVYSFIRGKCYMLMSRKAFCDLDPGKQAMIGFFFILSVLCVIAAVVYLIHRILTYLCFAKKISAKILYAERITLPTGQIMALFTCSYTYKDKVYKARVEKYGKETECKKTTEIVIDSRHPRKVLYPQGKILSTIGLILLLTGGSVLFYYMFESLYNYYC